MPETKRIHYLDNIRIYLTVIVILQHLTITYGAPGGWYYREFDFHQLDTITLAALVLFVAANQAYFMGFFFFLGGYFSNSSLKRKDSGGFLIQRIIRLGIPLLLFVYGISPILKFIEGYLLYSQPLSLENLQKIYKSIVFGYELGPMWFVLLMLIFSFLIFIINKTKICSFCPPVSNLTIPGCNFIPSAYPFANWICLSTS